MQWTEKLRLTRPDSLLPVPLPFLELRPHPPTHPLFPLLKFIPNPSGKMLTLIH